MESELTPLGVPLHEIEHILRSSDFDVVRDGGTLVMRRQNPVIREPLVTRIAVMPPDLPEAEAAAMTAVVRVFTLLPPSYAQRFDAEMVCFANRFAALGAFTVTDEASFIGSRFTIHGDNEDWLDQRHLIAAAAASADAAIGGMRRFLNKEQPPVSASAWTPADLEAVAAVLGEDCACTCDARRMTAKFRLGAMAPPSSAPGGAEASGNIAYWELLAGPPHIELGAGLTCVLQLPQRFAQAQSRHPAVNLLNVSEMNSPGLPPHIGAWCEGRAGDNFAYVSHLPNALHAVPGLPTEVSRWARRRAEAMANLLNAAQAAAT